MLLEEQSSRDDDTERMHSMPRSASSRAAFAVTTCRIGLLHDNNDDDDHLGGAGKKQRIESQHDPVAEMKRIQRLANKLFYELLENARMPPHTSLPFVRQPSPDVQPSPSLADLPDEIALLVFGRLSKWCWMRSLMQACRATYHILRHGAARHLLLEALTRTLVGVSPAVDDAAARQYQLEKMSKLQIATLNMAYEGMALHCGEAHCANQRRLINDGLHNAWLQYAVQSDSNAVYKAPKKRIVEVSSEFKKVLRMMPLAAAPILMAVGSNSATSTLGHTSVQVQSRRLSICAREDGAQALAVSVIVHNKYRDYDTNHAVVFDLMDVADDKCSVKLTRSWIVYRVRPMDPKTDVRLSPDGRYAFAMLSPSTFRGSDPVRSFGPVLLLWHTDASDEALEAEMLRIGSSTSIFSENRDTNNEISHAWFVSDKGDDGRLVTSGLCIVETVWTDVETSWAFDPAYATCIWQVHYIPLHGKGKEPTLEQFPSLALHPYLANFRRTLDAIATKCTINFDCSKLLESTYNRLPSQLHASNDGKMIAVLQMQGHFVLRSGRWVQEEKEDGVYRSSVAILKMVDSVGGCGASFQAIVEYDIGADPVSVAVDTKGRQIAILKLTACLDIYKVVNTEEGLLDAKHSAAIYGLAGVKDESIMSWSQKNLNIKLMGRMLTRFSPCGRYVTLDDAFNVGKRTDMEIIVVDTAAPPLRKAAFRPDLGGFCGRICDLWWSSQGMWLSLISGTCFLRTCPRPLPSLG